jgi:hypothetical protein
MVRDVITVDREDTIADATKLTADRPALTDEGKAG